MKKALLLTAVLTLTACATKGADTSAPAAKPKAVERSDEFKKCEHARLNLKVKGVSKFNEATPIKTVPLSYPEPALTNKVSGCVVIVYDVMPDGRADNMRVMTAIPADQTFGEAAARTLMEYEYPKKQVKNVVALIDFVPPSQTNTRRGTFR